MTPLMLNPFRRFLPSALMTMLTIALLNRAAAVVPHARDASVCRSVQAATVRIGSGTDRSSGVIVSPQGHVLTVSHGLHGSAGRVTVVLYDGSTAEASVLLVDSKADIAVLQIDSRNRGEFTSIRLPTGDNHLKNPLVFASGYPGRERDGLAPVIRVGELLVQVPLALRSTCTLTAGDSGGPLANHLGELIGVHRRIGTGMETNLHVPFELVRNAVLPVLDLNTVVQPTTPDRTGVLVSDSLTPSRAVATTLRSRTVKLRHAASDAEEVHFGTLLSDGLVAAKLSELTPDLLIHCRLPGGESSMATMFRSDRALDIAILKLADRQPQVTTLSVPEPAIDNRSNELQFPVVFAARNALEARHAGIVSRFNHAEADLPGRFGAVLKATVQSNALVVTDVAPNSSAASARLVAGSEIRSVNGDTVTSLEELERILSQHQPGDRLAIESYRDPELHSATVRLQHDPGEQFERSEFLDGRSGRVSERRSGFKGVLQHDIPIAPEDCGGPLCDASGQIVAINIARRARESSLAVPIGDVLKLAGLSRDVSE